MDSQHDPRDCGSATSAGTGKLRLSRPPAAARRSEAPPPLEMIHEDEFPPPDMRNARHQMSIDQQRRNGQLVEHNHEATLAEQLPYSQRPLPLRSEPGNFSSLSSVNQSSSLGCAQVGPPAQNIELFGSKKVSSKINLRKEVHRKSRNRKENKSHSALDEILVRLKNRRIWTRLVAFKTAWKTQAAEQL